MVAAKVLQGISGDDIVRCAARKRLINYARYIRPDYAVTPFHRNYLRLLDMFARGDIRKMIVQAPPQCGKSEGSSRILPSFMLGRNPDLRVVIGSYSSTIARDFNRDVQRIIDSREYSELFPGTILSGMAVGTDGKYIRTSDVIECCGRRGSLRVVGRGGSLTSKTVDVIILDDVYKDYAEGNSPVIRDAAWKWYTTVVRTRLHNNSQELIVFTRWNKDDLIGRIIDSGEKVVDAETWDGLQEIPADTWVRVNFEAIKVGAATEIDPRQPNEVLWADRHSLEQLSAQRELDPIMFQCLYQGNPGSAEGRLYHEFKTYTSPGDYGTYIRSGNYTDVADEGADYLCSVCYDIYRGRGTVYNERARRYEPLLYALVTDVVYTQDNADSTTITVPQMITRNHTQKCWIEANNGGSGWEKIVRRKVRAHTVPFTQHANKESRIITNSATVNNCIVFPFGWEERFPRFYQHITNYLADFKANTHDDAPDVLTGIIEKEILPGNSTAYLNKKNTGINYRN